MTDDLDPLEAELRALRPHEPSPALRRRLAADLAPPRRWGWRLALAGGLAAACVALVLFVNRGDRRAPAPVVAAPPVPPPTVQAYRLALAQSPEALDELLDRQAVRSAQAATPVTTKPAFLAWRGNR